MTTFCIAFYESNFSTGRGDQEEGQKRIPDDQKLVVWYVSCYTAEDKGDVELGVDFYYVR
jgi:hypothetical protein